MELILIGIAYLLVGAVISFYAWKKGLSWFRILLVCIILTPFVGFIIYANTNKVKIYQEKRYKCRRCNYYFTESHEYCPNCATDGEKVKLRIVNVDMT